MSNTKARSRAASSTTATKTRKGGKNKGKPEGEKLQLDEPKSAIFLCQRWQRFQGRLINLPLLPPQASTYHSFFFSHFLCSSSLFSILFLIRARFRSLALAAAVRVDWNLFRLPMRHLSISLLADFIPPLWPLLKFSCLGGGQACDIDSCPGSKFDANARQVGFAWNELSEWDELLETVFDCSEATTSPRPAFIAKGKKKRNCSSWPGKKKKINPRCLTFVCLKPWFSSLWSVKLSHAIRLQPVTVGGLKLSQALFTLRLQSDLLDQVSPWLEAITEENFKGEWRITHWHQ